MTAIAAGLDRVSQLQPGSGYFEALAGARGGRAGLEAYVRAELGAMTRAGAVYGFAEGNVRPGGEWATWLGAGLRW